MAWWVLEQLERTSPATKVGWELASIDYDSGGSSYSGSTVATANAGLTVQREKHKFVRSDAPQQLAQVVKSDNRMLDALGLANHESNSDDVIRTRIEARWLEVAAERALELVWQGNGRKSAIEVACSELIRNVFEFETMEHKLLVQISNLDLRSSEIALDERTKLRAATTDEIAAAASDEIAGLTAFAERWQGGNRRPMVVHDIYAIPSAILEIGVRNSVPRDSFTFDPAYDAASRLLVCLQIMGEEFVTAHSIWHEDADPFSRRFFGRQEFTRRKAVPRTGAARYELNEGKEARLRLLWRTLGGEIDSRLHLAIRRLTNIHERASLEDQVLDYWIGLETLFLDDSSSEMRYKGSMRIAQFLGDDAESRKQIFESAKKSYDVRSAIAHGSQPRKKNMNLEEVASVTGSWLRSASEKSLNDGFPPTGSRLDYELLS